MTRIHPARCDRNGTLDETQARAFLALIRLNSILVDDAEVVYIGRNPLRKLVCRCRRLYRALLRRGVPRALLTGAAGYVLTGAGGACVVVGFGFGSAWLPAFVAAGIFGGIAGGVAGTD